MHPQQADCRSILPDQQHRKYSSGYIRIRKELESYPELTFTVEETSGGVLVTFKQAGRVNEGINEGIVGLYNYVKQHPGLRIPELSKLLNVSSKTLERWLKQLKDDKRVIHRGSRKAGGYHVTEENS